MVHHAKNPHILNNDSYPTPMTTTFGMGVSVERATQNNNIIDHSIDKANLFVAQNYTIFEKCKTTKKGFWLFLLTLGQIAFNRIRRLLSPSLRSKILHKLHSMTRETMWKGGQFSRAVKKGCFVNTFLDHCRFRLSEQYKQSYLNNQKHRETGKRFICYSNQRKLSLPDHVDCK